MKLKQILSVFLAALLVVSLTLAAARVITWNSFWFLVIPIAVFAWWVLPTMK